jgi:hypothetical protein
MPAQYWLLLAAALALLCGRCLLRRVLLSALMGRTRCWRLRPASDGTLRTRFCRLRLYGIDNDGDASRSVACLRSLLNGQSVRWRVLSVDRDGTAVILLRIDGRNSAIELLRRGAVTLRGTGARRYRAAQAGVANGARRDNPCRPARREANPRRFMAPFPWWQG